MRDEILYMIHRYENKVRGLESSIEEEDKELDRMMMISRKNAYAMDMIPDLKRLLDETEEHKAQIILHFPDGDTVYGTFDFTSPGERTYVNELALKLKKERECPVEVRRI